jgi:hypothetical protein
MGANEDANTKKRKRRECFSLYASSSLDGIDYDRITMFLAKKKKKVSLSDSESLTTEESEFESIHSSNINTATANVDTEIELNFD